ncbi:ESCRT-II complex component (Vps25), putative [Talaromyces stipitatus ATCC 10500]|uniref:Vacuolar protein-sorting-associated protein 25 n=1 Tax=Talaromyces stipitatus (strain ATCC 10500 / CBS 375.48 / QM 6759 / NRRL 1006) TaxID=441959 RepID=B8LWH1_TALSN|nr:ESCRT-II complex component (Vps25), putative [Talaromyces stipitatus ATCC 10500]EED24282.1 ESCRT-II complex component (Vps25), putative [Talaromyces stipitatus ATCC 10500]
MSTNSPANSFLSAPTTAASVLTPASTISSHDPSIRIYNDPSDSSTTSARLRTTTPSGFKFPDVYDWPAFFTIQPNAQTRQAQMRRWASLISDWCRFHRTFRLSLTDAVDSPLFYNVRMRKRVGIQEAKTIIDWMTTAQEDGGGGRRAEWVPARSGTGVSERTIAWIWWRRPEEWAKLIADWIEDTAQKNTVLTVYELIHGDATISQEFHGMDSDVMLKSLNVLIKSGKAQVFGNDDEKGVKFF